MNREKEFPIAVEGGICERKGTRILLEERWEKLGEMAAGYGKSLSIISSVWVRYYGNRRNEILNSYIRQGVRIQYTSIKGTG